MKYLLNDNGGLPTMSNISEISLTTLFLSCVSDEELELAMRSGKVRRLHPIALHPDGEWWSYHCDLELLVVVMSCL